MGEGEWIKILSSVDLTAMAAIGIVALICERSSRISDAKALLIPLGLGVIWGILEASQQGWAEPYIIAKGALLNGAGASVVAQLVSQGWDAAIAKAGGGSGGSASTQVSGK